ncbi:hypothetical protein EVAR_9227_1 [Eumeta japonica]|uniref:Uncharacterized protein n=1 Tax=Eumeta variegata TaxID=151549 RepID=A0A4C2AGS3_EUMVA|nr:hypothetical protein EVAR_9227_1 [Eumeta japonica]
MLAALLRLGVGYESQPLSIVRPRRRISSTRAISVLPMRMTGTSNFSFLVSTIALVSMVQTSTCFDRPSPSHGLVPCWSPPPVLRLTVRKTSGPRRPRTPERIHRGPRVRGVGSQDEIPKVGPAIEPCIQPFEVILLDSPPAYRTTTSRSLRSYRVLRPALWHETILPRLQLRHYMPLDAPDEHPFHGFPITGKAYGTEQSQVPQDGSLAYIRSEPVNPRGFLGLNALRAIFTSAPVKAGPSRTRYPKPPAGGYFRRFVFLVPCGTDHPCRHGHQEKDTIPYALPVLGGAKPFPARRLGIRCCPFINLLGSHIFLDHIPASARGCVSDATLLVFASLFPSSSGLHQGSFGLRIERFRGMAVSHACLTHSVYRSTTSSSRSHESTTSTVPAVRALSSFALSNAVRNSDHRAFAVL